MHKQTNKIIRLLEKTYKGLKVHSWATDYVKQLMHLIRKCLCLDAVVCGAIRSLISCGSRLDKHRVVCVTIIHLAHA